jgi:hypothetical protein
VAGSCEHGNESSGFKKPGNWGFLNYLSGYHLQKDSGVS